jgi:hypothetical protein
VRPAFSILAVSALLAACAGVAPTASPVPTAPPTATPTPSPVPTPTPRLALRFPSASEIGLAPGRYRSSPPFDLSFTFDIPEAGWQSGHLAPDFFDVLQLTAPGHPNHWVAFALPQTIVGSDGPIDVTGLDPTEAALAIAARGDLDATAPTRFDFAGLPATRMDISTDRPGVKLFGGAVGDFMLDPTQDVRLILAPLDEELMLVLVMAPKGGLETTWLKALPILGSVVFD